MSLPDPPPVSEREPMTNVKKVPAPSAYKAIVIGLVVVAAIFAIAFAVAGFLTFDIEPTSSPSPSPAPAPASAAPSDAVVEKELRAQLAAYLTQGGSAAQARADSYEQGVESAGKCQVGFDVGQDLPTKAEANAAGLARIKEIRSLAAMNQDDIGIAAVTAEQANGNYSWFLLFVACPSVPA
jgi:hypothetical protein